MLTLISDPSKNISGYDSFAAATTQHRYEFQKWHISGLTSDSVSNKFIFPPADGDVTAKFPAGKVFYFEGTSATGFYTVSSSAFTTQTEVTPVETIPASEAGYIYSDGYLENYLVQVEIPELDNITLYYLPNSTGKIIFDLGPTLMRAIDQYLYYAIVTTELWEGSSESPVTRSSILAVKANKQLLSDNGSNLYAHLASTSKAAAANILTNQSGPRYWEGWKRTYSYINDDYNLVDYHEQWLDANKTLITDNESAGTVVVGNAVNNIPFFFTSPPTNAKYVRIFAEKTATQFIENKDYLIEPECREPVMIEWLNQLGGYDQWLFSYEQAVTDDAREGLIYETGYTDDISTVTQTIRRAPGSTRQLMTVKVGHLSQNDIQHLHEIKLSEEVRVWLLKDGSEYINVIVNSGYQTTFTTGKGGYEFSLNIQFPDGFDFFKGKGY